jgi:hypothetical protein
MHHFEPCPDCSRHVRVHEMSCPFCGASLSLTQQPSTPSPLPRLARAAALALSAALASATVLASCGGRHRPTGGGKGGSAGSSGRTGTGGSAGKAGSGGSAGVGGGGVGGLAGAGGLGVGIPIYGASPPPRK